MASKRAGLFDASKRAIASSSLAMRSWFSWNSSCPTRFACARASFDSAASSWVRTMILR